MTVATGTPTDRPVTAVLGARRGRGVVVALALALGVLVVFAAGIGAVRIAPGEVLAILAHKAGLPAPWTFAPRQAAVLLEIRLPRIVLGALVGAVLALAGAVMQGLFRNPLADPGLLGVSSGAALAAATSLVFGRELIARLPPVLALWALPIAAFGGAIVASRAVMALARSGGETPAASMLLAGVGVNAIASAGTAWLTFVATDAQLRSLTFWSLGSLGAATWSSVSAIAPFVGAAIIGLPRLARGLNALLLGDAEAAHLGVAVERVKRVAVLLIAFAVGAAVALTGVVGFVGLMVPHVIRLAIGPDHRTLLPASALLGAAMLIGADTLARTAVAPAELPLGVVTAAAGAPFLLWLLRREGAARGRA